MTDFEDELERIRKEKFLDPVLVFIWRKLGKPWKAESR
jgi:hypothetical protein